MTQNERIEKHLRSGKSITPLLALKKFNCFRLGARIYDCRNKGMIIKKEIVKGKSYAKYSML